jgi:hypothetical protein
VRYSIEGSIQQATLDLRINARLLDAQNYADVWADDSIPTTTTFCRHGTRLVFLFGQEGRWRFERGEARRAGQAWCKREEDPEAKSAPTEPLSKPFDLPGEHISHAALGLDHLRRARVVLQFAAKAENLHIYTAIEHVFVDSSRL